MRIKTLLFIGFLWSLFSLGYTQIVSGPINQVISGVGQITLDINNDGTDDFIFEIIELSPSVYVARVIPFSQILDNSTYGYPDALNLNDPVDGHFHSNTGVLGTLNSAGNFNGAGDKYLGITIGTLSGIYKGWILLNCSQDRDVLTLISYGFQTNSVNGNITAGQTIDNTSVIAHSESLITVFPNPSHNFIYVHSNSKEELEIKLFDIHGREVLRMNQARPPLVISVAELPPGFYLLQAFGSNGSSSLKILVE